MEKITLKSDVFPRNITLSKENYLDIRPNRVPRRLTVYFAKKTGRSIPLEKDIAYYVVNHYNDICVLNDKGEKTEMKDELESLNVTQIRKEVAKWNRKVKSLGMKGINVLGISKKDAVQQIRDWRALGVEA